MNKNFSISCLNFLQKTIRVRKHMNNRSLSRKDCARELTNLEPLIAELNYDSQRLAKFIQLWKKEIKEILPGSGCKCHLKMNTEFINLLDTAEKLYQL